MKSEKLAASTDKELYRETEDYYSPSIHVTKGGSIGMNVGGTVFVKPIREWHHLADNGGWMNARIQPPNKSKMYWGVIETKSNLGANVHQGKVGYQKDTGTWFDSTLERVNVTYYRELPELPAIYWKEKDGGGS